MPTWSAKRVYAVAQQCGDSAGGMDDWRPHHMKCITMLAALTLIIKSGDNLPLLIIGSISLGFALFNVIGGFLVTDRMLAMFSRKKTRK